MRYFSTFSGIGGFELAIKQAYENLENIPVAEKQQLETENTASVGQGRMDTNWKWERPRCIGYSEIDKYAVQIYEKHFRHKNYGDITKINASELPDFDLLVGGFPCQAFSIAGKRQGFNDTRGTLFFDLARILKEKQPRYFIFENVKGLLSHDSGNTFKTIIATIDELGYDCQWQVLNSKNFGVPQNRERVFIIGHLRGTSRPEVFPIRKSSQGNLKYSGGVISAREQWLKDGKSNSRNFSQGQRIYSTDGISQTLAGQAGGQGGKTGLYQISNASKREFGFKNVSPALMTRDYKEPKLVNTPLQIRRLTPTECERLQGFPDGWTEGVSDTQRYKCLGNAVTVNVIREIIKRLVATTPNPNKE